MGSKFFRQVPLTRPIAGCVVLLTLSLLGCEQPRQAAGNAKPAPAASVPRYSGAYPFEVVTTCGMVTDIVRRVVGEQGNVAGLMGEGVDPHLYKPTRNDVRRLLGADIVFYSGLLLEGRMSDAFTQVARKGRPVFAVTENIDESYLLEPPHLQGHWDPHVWMDVAAWSQCAEFVAEVLQEFDPDHAADYKRRADAYRQELAELDAYVHNVIATIPEQQRVLVTAHDAFGYFSQAYGIAVHSVQGISTESEPAVSDINRLVDLLVERKLPAIFVESSVNPENIRAVIEGARQRG